MSVGYYDKFFHITSVSAANERRSFRFLNVRLPNNRETDVPEFLRLLIVLFLFDGKDTDRSSADKNGTRNGNRGHGALAPLFLTGNGYGRRKIFCAVIEIYFDIGLV